MRGLLLNLRAGWRFATFRPTAAEDFVFSLDQLVALAAFGLAVGAASGLLHAPEPAEFNAAALSEHALVLGLALLGVYFGARPGGGAGAVLRVAVVILAAAPWFTLLDAGLAGAAERLPESVVEYAPWGVFAWSVLTDLRAFRLALAQRWGGALLRFAPYAAMVALPMGFAPPEPFWVEREAPGDERPRVDAEAVFYAQPERLRAALAALEPQRPGVPDLYFVGFGGYAHEDVFMHEVRYARALFDRRFGTAGRSLVLVNNPATVEQAPIASRTNLRRTLEHLGRRVMDPDEDILFLFLSSHGEPGEVTVDFWPLDLNAVRAGELRQMLDDAGIRWRVVVVSACYSGGFVEALRDDNTLVITAARADRASFGCSHEASFTYFGHAYFGEQLLLTRSFTEAFDGAAGAVAAREQRERREHSEPQMHAGAAIVGHLRAWQARLEVSQGAAPEPSAAAEERLRRAAGAGN